MLASTSVERAHRRPNRLTPLGLHRQNRRYRGRGGVSEENRSACFLPAFLDSESGRVYLSRFHDGRVAPMHLLDGLPPEVVVSRGLDGHVTAVKGTITAGFVRDRRFYTRAQAACACGR